VEQQYDNKLGFESKIRALREELDKLNIERDRIRSELLLLPLVRPKLIKLTQSGISEQDIINVSGIFEKFVGGLERQSFISELEKYGSLRAVMERLAKDSQRLKKDICSLQTQKQDLEESNKKVLLSLAESRRIFYYMTCSVKSSRAEILGLVWIAASVAYLIKMQFENVESLKLKHTVDVSDEFDSLRRAYRGGQSVSIQAIKKEVIMAIEVMQSKLGVNDELSEILSKTLIALTGKPGN
jgi:phage host-nuclease inhibitor protein Gam